MLKQICWTVSVLALATAAVGAEELRLPKIFSDGMVLQREMPVNVWGWAPAGAAVEVVFAGQAKRAAAGDDGRWSVALDPMPASAAGRAFVVRTLGAAAREVVVKDALVGEVWFTAGQSNMMMAVGSATGGKEFFERHHNDTQGRLRVVSQLGPHLQADTPQTDIAAAWGQPTVGYSAVSYWFAHKLYQHFQGKVPVGMITYTAIVGAEAWVSRPTLENDPRLKPLLADALKFDSQCYNGVISAIAPYSIRGVLYYQAEYNGFGERAIQFRALFPSLISDWRRAWQRPDLPFLFVQLPGFIAQEAPPKGMDMDPATLAKYRDLQERKTWTEVRESQLLTWQTVPHTGMAVAIDVGEPYDIHPPRKEPVAERLFLQARRVAYGEDLVCSGPVPAKTEVRQNEVVVTFDHVGGGLVARGGELKGFELAGPEAVYHPAAAAIRGAQVILRSDHVTDPRHWRYAWDGCPDATLYNEEGLPATPYRWSDWSRSPQPAASRFDWPNASFEQLNQAGQPVGWRLGPGAMSASDKAADGRRSVVLTEPNKSGLFITGITQGAGAYWNNPPLAPAAVRPGCLVRYGVSVAVAPGSGEQKLYLNLCQNDTGGGYQAWDGLRVATTAREDFTGRTIVQRLTDTMHDSHFVYGDAVGARFIFQGGAAPGKLYVDALTPVEILRPLLEIDNTAALDLGTCEVGAARESARLTIRNGQRGTFRQVLTDADPGTEFATVLYGAAGFVSDAMGIQQRIIARTDHVGALLIGADAARFEFVSDHRGRTQQQLKLIGADGQGGLLGGAAPEEETFAVRFTGADRPGAYRAVLRIVTQAGNVGVLSQGAAGEPPIHLYYLDQPVTVRVTNHVQE